MSPMASQITSLTIVYPTVYSRRRSKKSPKLRVTGLCEGNSPVTGEFPAQRVSNAEMFPFDDVIMWYAYSILTSNQFVNPRRLCWVWEETVIKCTSSIQDGHLSRVTPENNNYLRYCITLPNIMRIEAHVYDSLGYLKQPGKRVDKIDVQIMVHVATTHNVYQCH